MKNDNKKTSFLIQKIYTKDVSLETLNVPDCFKDKWDPTSDLKFNIEYKKIDDINFELDLTMTIKTKNNDKNVYVIEVNQSGIFTLTGMTDEQIDSVLNTYCAHTLFCYAKRTIDSSVIKGGFLPLNLVPINFDAIYMENKANKPVH